MDNPLPKRLVWKRKLMKFLRWICHEETGFKKIEKKKEEIDKKYRRFLK